MKRIEDNKEQWRTGVPPRAIVVNIRPEAMKKIKMYVQACDIEISGLGEIISLGAGKFEVTDVFLYNQTCTGTSTSLSNEDLTRFAIDRLNAGKDVEKIRFWWHSHVDMDAFWSGQDERAIEVIESDYLVSFVMNKRGEYRIRFDFFKPCRLTLDETIVTMKSEESVSAEEFAAVKVEIEEKVKRTSYLVRESSGAIIDYRCNAQSNIHTSSFRELEYFNSGKRQGFNSARSAFMDLDGDGVTDPDSMMDRDWRREMGMDI